MIYPDKTQELRSIIYQQLFPLIDHDYVYLDLPYHQNIGDTLIWEGTRRFLSLVRHRCLYSTGWQAYRKPDIDRQTVILLHGGGNWGDLWPAHHEFRKRVITDFPDNPTIVLPQSVHYQEQVSLEADIDFYSRHPHVVICTRDRHSQSILQRHLPNRILLVPDMAFFFNPAPYRAGVATVAGKILFAKRTDKELRTDMDISMVPQSADVYDWPTMEPSNECLTRITSRLRQEGAILPFKTLWMPRWTVDGYWDNCMRPYLLHTAVRFLAPYETVYSTRLHISILSVLMGKDLHILDNSYSKTRNYFSTWF